MTIVKKSKFNTEEVNIKINFKKETIIFSH